MRGTVEGLEHSAQDLTHLIDTVDLPGLIGEHFPESGCKPGTAGSFKAVWRGDERASGSVYRNEKGAWLWKDHGVGEAGTAYHFLTDILDMNTSKAAEEVKRLAHVTHEASAQVTGRTPRRIVASYDYVDEHGTLLFQALRYEPKGFSQRRPDGQSGWIHNLQGLTPVLFRLPRVLEAVEGGRAVYIVEGEKDVLALEAQGITATCILWAPASGGASTARR